MLLLLLQLVLVLVLLLLLLLGLGVLLLLLLSAWCLMLLSAAGATWSTHVWGWAPSASGDGGLMPLLRCFAAALLVWVPQQPLLWLLGLVLPQGLGLVLLVLLVLL